MTFRLATPADLARMSWHQREKYHQRRRAYAEALECERPAPAAVREPGYNAAAAAAIHAIAALLDPILTAADSRGGYQGQPLAPHGTESAYRRHQRWGEAPCEECIEGARKYWRDRWRREHWTEVAA